jgi:hypothetical protein
MVLPVVKNILFLMQCHHRIPSQRILSLSYYTSKFIFIILCPFNMYLRRKNIAFNIKNFFYITGRISAAAMAGDIIFIFLTPPQQKKIISRIFKFSGALKVKK